MGRGGNNYTTLLCIKTNQEHQNQLLILPVEVEVSSGELIDYTHGTLTGKEGGGGRGGNKLHFL